MSQTIYKRDFHLGPILFEILNFDQIRFRITTMPKRFVIDIFYWQIWVSRI